MMVYPLTNIHLRFEIKNSGPGTLPVGAERRPRQPGEDSVSKVKRVLRKFPKIAIWPLLHYDSPYDQQELSHACASCSHLGFAFCYEIPVLRV